MNRCMLQRARPVAARVQRPHHPQSDTRVVRIEHRSLLPPFHCSLKVPIGLGSLGQRFQRPSIERRKSLALSVRPVLELRCLVQEEAVEQRTSVKRHGGCVISSIEGGLEFDHVRPNDIGVQPKEIALGQERRLGQGLAKDIGRDLEQVASAFAIAFRPQRRDQAVASETPAGRQGEEGEQGHTVPLRGSAGSGPAVALERRASKEAEMEERLGIQRGLPGRHCVFTAHSHFLVDATAAHPAVQACGCCRATNL